MNISDNILQAAIDAAFREQPDTHLLTWPDNAGSWTSQEAQRLDIFRRALAVIAPHLATAGVGEYTDEEIDSAWQEAWILHGCELSLDWLRSFLSALPRRESPALAEAIAWAEKAEALRDFEYSKAEEAIAGRDRTYAEICRAARSVGWVDMAESGPITTFIRKIGDELSALRARAEKAEGILKKCMSVMPIGNINTHTEDNLPGRISDLAGELAALSVENERLESELAALRRAVKAHLEEFEWMDGPEGWTESCASLHEPEAAAQPVPAATPKPAEEVPLGPEDCPPGSVFNFGASAAFITPLCVSFDGVGFPETEPNKPLIQKFSFELLQEVARINTSLPDTGRWDATAWRRASKKGVAK